ncbi:CTP:molybdopterin cytidylyltransferase MocA [Silvibacterium bohemicum]|uniref:CTP:molybdopterin cytidylyltransferase MocA n=1 Tax=Silvibacterium bohemicum TaxID=1577686 RepID=A0A841JVW2_9BACT|nr:nucleotidyltransferase family protein [Silvibacterium bohemicum]MBB6144685.1 CTP:molybdopterin cytidylyltransferase MocA [Silvibacterium bohemicum]
MSRTGAVILAAGSSTRLQEPKQLVMIGKENLLERSVRVAIEANCLPIVVVLGFSAELVGKSCNLYGSDVVINDDWAEGMGTSINVGIRSLRDVDGAMVMTCDMPAVTASHLRKLMMTGETTASLYAGRRGVPAYFPQSMFPLLVKLRGDIGAKDLLQSARTVGLPGGELDVDTVRDVEQARALFS